VTHHTAVRSEHYFNLLAVFSDELRLVHVGTRAFLDLDFLKCAGRGVLADDALNWRRTLVQRGLYVFAKGTADENSDYGKREERKGKPATHAALYRELTERCNGNCVMRELTGV
jgi:hypothetical protein